MGYQGELAKGLTQTTDPALGDGDVSPLQLDPKGRLKVTNASTEYETVAASQTAQILGATGAVGDLLEAVLIVPATTSPGAVSIRDGNGSDITIFTGGATSVADLSPIHVPLGLRCLAATTPGWKITTGANVSVIGIGNFT